MPALRAGPIPRGSLTSILRARRRSDSSSSTQRNSPRLRSTTPFARCRRRRCSKAGWLRRLRASASASRRRSASRTSSVCANAMTMSPSSSTALEPVRQAGKLGLLLFQLPPNFKADAERLSGFLATPALRTRTLRPIAFEFRHESWFADEIYAVLREHNAALCIAESDDLLTPEVHTAARHTCYRLRRSGGYSAVELAAFAKRFAALARQRDVYVYFKHEDEPTGALNASAFLARAEFRGALMQTAEIETIASHAADFRPRRFLTQRSSADHRRQLSRHASTICRHPRRSWSRSRPRRRTRSQARSSATATGSRRRSARRGRPPSSCTASKARRTRSTSSATRTSCGAPAATSSA